ncbi:Crp/Fnr family transcriptional regulator [Rhizobium hidalgonense]|uniref:Crp/Fnr family transcriptional regulator n=1 Tax=Rhizobium hidalgonense TaxID=1538159 RepID=UPI0019D4D97C|nr:Crp/Fnr family transcriptional regulator [Rhizobium hidalgonense]
MCKQRKSAPETSPSRGGFEAILDLYRHKAGMGARTEATLWQKSRKKAPENRLLRRLPREAFDDIAPYLSPADLPARCSLVEVGKPIEHVYFIESGLASMVALTSDGNGVEVGQIGFEGIRVDIRFCSYRPPAQSNLDTGFGKRHAIVRQRRISNWPAAPHL